jgi:nitrate/nitrite-specific signal transduction histidine kinase
VEVVGDRLVLTVRDNGQGFDTGAAGEGGFGLTSMRERASLIDGRISISSRPRDGTLVSIDLPVPAGEPGVAGTPGAASTPGTAGGRLAAGAGG